MDNRGEESSRYTGAFTCDSDVSKVECRTEPVSLAPMIDKSDRDWRWVMRHITRHTLLYTEMITAPAVIHGDRKRLLEFDELEKPLVLQLGWDDEKTLFEACSIAKDYGYDEVNLNCGCPSDRVQRHNFGAALMAEPVQAAGLLRAMQRGSGLSVSVKCRIGIKSARAGIDLTSYEHLKHFVRVVSDSGCRKFIVHARIAILEGLSPRKNREVPPLRYDDVYRLKQDFPDLFIEINGGFRNFSFMDEALKHLDGVMIGRLALDNPWLLAGIDRHFFGSHDVEYNRREILGEVIDYLGKRASEGASQGLLVQPIMNIFAGEPGARTWRRFLTGAVSVEREKFAAVLESGFLNSRESMF